MDDLAPPLAPLDTPNGEGNGGPGGYPHRYPHGDEGEWLSINAAARRLGVTATAIRNRIKRGTLQARPNGNIGKLVLVPLTVPVTVILTPRKPVTLTPEDPVSPVTLTPDGPVTLTPEESVPLTVTLTALRDHIESLKVALAKAESENEQLRPERERADRLEVEVATIPGMQETIEAQRDALKSLLDRVTEIAAERDRLLNRSWWQRLVG